MKSFLFLLVLSLIAILAGFSVQAAPHAQDDFLKLFSTSKPLIAAVMVNADEKPEENAKAAQWALEQLKIAEDGGMQGILIEFRGGEILKPAITKQKYQAMLSILKQVTAKATKAVVGVEILWHYPEETLKIAKEGGARFVRIDFFSDHVIADKAEVPINPEALLKYKKKIKADDVFLLTDIQVKYSEMIDKNITIAQSAENAIKKGSQGLIVSADKSGSAPSKERMALARSGIFDKTPLLIGSGFSTTVAKDIIPLVDAVIVGTSISVKTGGPLLPEKVKELVETVNKLKAQ